VTAPRPVVWAAALVALGGLAALPGVTPAPAAETIHLGPGGGHGGALPSPLPGAAPIGRARMASPSQDLPCGVTYDRTVLPPEIVVSSTVHVHIQVDGSCEGGSRGINIFFVVDRSVTMFEDGFIDPTKSALKNFVNSMDFTKSTAGLITYADKKQVNKPLTSDRDAMLVAIDRIRLSEENDVRSLPAAFRDATQLIDRDGIEGNDKIVLIIAAGPDKDNALVNMPTVTQAARNAGVKVVFLMFPDSRYLHYVEAASDCTGTFCGLWGSRSGQLSKWAWGVDSGSIDSRLQMLVPLLLRGLELTRIEVEDFVHSGAEVLPSSVQPLPTNFAGGPAYRDMIWDFNPVPPGGVRIDYDARMIFEDETYPVAELSELALWYSDGTAPRMPLPNPDIIVRSEITPTPTSPRPSATPSPTAAVATATPQGPTEWRVYLPVNLEGGEL